MTPKFEQPVRKGNVRVKFHKFHLGNESGWRDVQPQVIDTSERKCWDGYRMTNTTPPTVLSASAGKEEKGTSKATDGLVLVGNGMSSLKALTRHRDAFMPFETRRI